MERASEKESWSLPGKWPTRAQEVNKTIDILLGLRSRFAPVKDKVLGSPELVVKLTWQKPGSQSPENITLEFETETVANMENRFSLPTFVRVKDKNIVLRMGPGLVAALDHPVDFFQQRRLFQGERLASTAKEGSLS